MVDNVSYIQGPAQALVIIHHPYASNDYEQGMGGLEGHIGLRALQPVPSLSGSCVGGEEHGHLVYKYTWSIGNCATWNNIIPAPSSCHSLVAFKLATLTWMIYQFQGVFVATRTNLIPSHSCKPLVQAVVNHSLKRSLETQKRKQRSNRTLPYFHCQKG